MDDLSQLANASELLQDPRLLFGLFVFVLILVGIFFRSVIRQLFERQKERISPYVDKAADNLNRLKGSRWAISEKEQEDLAYVRDADAAVRDAPSRIAARFTLFSISLFLVFVVWAYFATLEEVARGDGRVIPSSKTQVVQSLEGGIVKAILIREGDKVKRGQTLLRIDDTGFSADLGELEAKRLSLEAQVARLRTEAGSFDNPTVDDIAFAKELLEIAPQVVENEKTLFQIRKRNLDNQLVVLTERLKQKRLELAEYKENKKKYREGLKIARSEHALLAPLAKRGIVPKPQLMKLDREINSLKGDLAAVDQSIPRIEAAIREAESLLTEQRLKFREAAQTELNTKLADLSVVRESLTGAKDKVVRTEIRAPSDGYVNKLHVNTIGGVMRAGEPLIEITPLEDNLLVEVNVSPKDIAFIRPGQPAVVKITAYDFTVYGGLDGNVEVISSDSTFDEESKENFYSVTVKTKRNSLRKGEDSLPIIPGMVATVDIITGEKSVLDYIFKPIVKARYEALRER